jgi:hypothetical protein
MSNKHNENVINEVLALHYAGLSQRQISDSIFGTTTKKSTVGDIISRHRGQHPPTLDESDNNSGPRILIVDIETAPIRAAVWSLWENNVGLNQIGIDWFLLSYSAKWVGNDEVFYNDMRGVVHTEDDMHLLEDLWHLMDEADIIIGHNSKKFDTKKINARFIANGFPQPSPYKQVDTLGIAKAQFAFTSNKLEYLSKKLCKKYSKSEHKKFHGYHLWEQCLLDNEEAWLEMQVYNEVDVLSTEELYMILRSWDNKHPNLALFYDDDIVRCNVCGGTDLELTEKHARTNLSKFELYRCNDCGHFSRTRKNVLSKDKKESLNMNVGQ